MKELTPKIFCSFLLHTGLLSLCNGYTVNPQQKSMFVVPNKEIRYMIDSQFMAPFYEKIASTKCTVRDREIIV